MKEQLRNMLPSFEIIHTSHVRRTGNKMVDRLANHGVENTNDKMDHSWNQLQLQPLREDLTRIKE